MATKLYAARGADLIVDYEFPGAIDLTGYTASFTVYADQNGNELLAVTEVESGSGSVITLGVASLNVRVVSADILGLPLGDDETQPSLLAFNLLISSPSGIVSKIHGGTFIVNPLGSPVRGNADQISCTIDGVVTQVTVDLGSAYAIQAGEYSQDAANSAQSAASILESTQALYDDFTALGTGLQGQIDDREVLTNKITSLSASSTDSQYPSAKLLYDQLVTREKTDNKVTSLSGASTNTQYPSAKAVYDELQGLGGEIDLKAPLASPNFTGVSGFASINYAVSNPSLTTNYYTFLGPADGSDIQVKYGHALNYIWSDGNVPDGAAHIVQVDIRSSSGTPLSPVGFWSGMRIDKDLGSGVPGGIDAGCYIACVNNTLTPTNPSGRGYWTIFRGAAAGHNNVGFHSVSEVEGDHHPGYGVLVDHSSATNAHEYGVVVRGWTDTAFAASTTNATIQGNFLRLQNDSDFPFCVTVAGKMTAVAGIDAQAAITSTTALSVGLTSNIKSPLHIYNSNSGTVTSGNATAVAQVSLDMSASTINDGGGLEFKLTSAYGNIIKVISDSGSAMLFGGRQNSSTWTEYWRTTPSGDIRPATDGVQFNGAPGFSWNQVYTRYGLAGMVGVPNYANDAAAAAGGVAVGQMYRNGSVLMVRVT